MTARSKIHTDCPKGAKCRDADCGYNHARFGTWPKPKPDAALGLLRRIVAGSSHLPHAGMTIPGARVSAGIVIFHCTLEEWQALTRLADERERR